MDRKKTILIAVLVNAGLLVLLFIMALYREDAPVKNTDLQQLSQQQIEPLFPEFQEQNASLVSTAGEDVETLVQAAVPKASEPVHQLPPLAAVEMAPVPVAPPHSVPAPTPPASMSLTQVTVKKGDTLEKIARFNHISVDEIVRLNQLSSSFLRIGQKLKIPGEKERIAAHKTLPGADKRSLEVSHMEYYTVKVGDNPWTIARKHHLKVDELLKLNDLNEDKARRLKPGDHLRIR